MLKKTLNTQKYNLLGGLMVAGLLAGLYWISQTNYLLFHSLAELFGIVITGGIFTVYWNARHVIEKNYFVSLSVAFLFVGMFDLIHALAYKGMGVFPAYDANLPTQLWIAARYLESLSLLGATFFLHRKLNARIFLHIYAVIFILVLSAIFLGVFPDCYIEGAGLTPFKKISEYLIALILVVAIVRLKQKKANFEDKVFNLLVAALLTTILAELSFTFYISVYGFSNFVGHIFKITSFSLIYLALLRIGLTQPHVILFREFKKREKELQKSQQKLSLQSAALEAADNAILITNRDGNIEWVNPAWETLTGYSSQEALGENPRLLKSGHHDQAFYKNLWDTILSGQTWQGKLINQRKDGSTYTEEETITPMHNPQGEITHFIGIQKDITERVQVEKALHESENLLNGTQQLAKVGGWKWNIETQTMFWTAETYRIHGIDPVDIAPGSNEHIDRNLECYDEKDRQTIMDAFQKCAADGTAYDLEFPFTTFDGRRIWIRTIGHAEKENGKVVSVIGNIMDISDRKVAEEALRRYRDELEQRVTERTAELNQRVSEMEQLNQAMISLMEDVRLTNSKLTTSQQKLAQINQELESFAYSVSHDLRAPLRHISSFAAILQSREKDHLDEKSLGYLENVTTSAARMGKLIDDLLAFSRAGRTAMKLRRVDSARIITEVRQEMEQDLEGRAITWEIAPLPAVRADPTLLKIVWSNLLSNAIKYTRPHPEAIIEIGTHPSEEDENMVVFYVRDNGVGFDMSYVDKIFGVFQRLHSDEQFEGTGIGLATVRRLVIRHGGRIWAEGEVGVGATFYFTMPVSSKQ